jgi:hypothetical protein
MERKVVKHFTKEVSVHVLLANASREFTIFIKMYGNLSGTQFMREQLRMNET